MPQALSEDSVYSSAWDVELKKMSEQSRLLKRMNLDAPIRVNLSAAERKYLLEQIKPKINPNETQSNIGLTSCKQNGCFFFVPPQDLPSETIQSAQLVIKSGTHLNEPRRVDIYEITPSGTYEELARNVVAPMNQNDISIDITSATRQWMSSNGRQRRTLQIYVDGRSMDAYAAEVEVIQKNDENSPPPALKAGCTYNSNCCLQYFYLNFTEIGWDNWILSPEGYQANLCTGKCRLRLPSWWNTEINPKRSVCAPIKFKPLTIIYLAGPNDIRQKTIHGMQAVECGCD
uniref:TGF-beta family profile domain-containing protein n=1 Tax=Acrobeloides nanus TaxID=290746 RepID=A0A914CB34_9BILA